MHSEQPLQDSGHRKEFPTGAIREGAPLKGMWHLLPYATLQRLAVHFEKGAAKYAARNWEKGIPLSSYFDSLQRHLWKWWSGEEDEDHLAAMVWNAVCLCETYIRIKLGVLPAELDDRPKVEKPPTINYYKPPGI